MTKSKPEIKIVDVIGDFVFFANGKLFNDKLVFRWDLHLINKPHKDTKGIVTGVENVDDELSEKKRKKRMKTTHSYLNL